ncbi:hypothetical protein SAMN05192563_103810 [Paraburkholderia aspalathi]|uniref:Uncharacterized protein n=1 Tax=Paraburkholderia aspalathi TaxID=1324617 RepID=A0A1I7ENM9_9BURK|nr:hypothetical protein SAMN05192563_103810 [Paraburkholderia aspalathi]
MDIPEFAASILDANAVSDYFANEWGFLTEKGTGERIWAAVSYLVRALLLRCPDEREAIEIVSRSCAQATRMKLMSRRASLV